MKKFTKFKATIMKWSKRKLTFEGKKTLINAYIMSSISYLAETYRTYSPTFYKANKRPHQRFLALGGLRLMFVIKPTSKRSSKKHTNMVARLMDLSMHMDSTRSSLSSTCLLRNGVI